MLTTALRAAGLTAEACRDAGDLTGDLMSTAGAVLLAEEALTPGAMATLMAALDHQPPWSDIPIIILTASGRMAEPSVADLKRFNQLGNITLLERPIRVMTLHSSVESALRARRRQYEVRDHLLERECTEAALKAESRAKDEFLAMLGHELRNPLGALAGAAHLLDVTAPNVGDDGSEQARRVMERQVRHLTRLVDDLLDVSRVTTGKIELSRRPLDAAAAVANCVAALRAAGRVDAHSLEVVATPVWVEADEVRLDQIINNLLVNALKYTPEGGRIEVSVRQVDADAEISVQDTGIGIAGDLLPHVFDLFVQGGRAIERQQGGLGIGLTLVRRLVELHGGSAEAKSAGTGQGSTFVVRLPAVPAPVETTLPAAPSNGRRARRILLVEDNDDARQVMVLTLRDVGHEVYEASDGPTGVAVALRERPDVAIIDVGLPGLNGYEVAERIRAAPEAHGMILIALTGYGLPDDRRRATAAGFDRYLVKPIDFDQLERMLASGDDPRPAA
jgi:signal transduction histidine kinase/ActR/RegA family two-component response regulator